MQFSADQGCEVGASERPRIGHRIAVALEKMIAEGEKIITRAMIAVDDLGGRMVTVRIGRMGMEIALEEMAGPAERQIFHFHTPLMEYTLSRENRGSQAMTPDISQVTRFPW